MGYRSDVAYVIRFKSFEERDAYAVSIRLAGSHEMNQAIEECDLPRGKPLITFRAEDQKWYPDYVDVAAHTQLYQDAEKVFDADFIFAALGEDGKTEYEYSTHGYDLTDYVNVVHKLETSF
jgi:hypothetical protein